MRMKTWATGVVVTAALVVSTSGSAAIAAPSVSSNCTDQWVATKAFGNVGTDTRQYAPQQQIAGFYGGFAHVHDLTAGECLGLLGP